jgi:hypothetical protein
MNSRGRLFHISFLVPKRELGNLRIERGTPMASRKSKRSKGPYAQNPLEIIIKEKSKEFLSAEREYWKERDALRKSMKGPVDALSLKAGEALPANISTTVWGLRDGVAFVRHKSVTAKPTVQFRILPLTLEQWGDTGLLVPLDNGEISLARAGFITQAIKLFPSSEPKPTKINFVICWNRNY